MAATPLLLTEGESPRTVALTDAEYVALQQLSLVNVTPTLTHGFFDVAAGRKVGAVLVGQRQVVVRPKITNLNRLLFLLGYAQDPGIWRDELVQLSGDEDLLPALAEAFGRIALRAVEQGLLQGYRTINDRLPVLRGRLLASEQMTRLYGLPVPVAVEYDDFTVDIAENQLLLLAVNWLIAVPRLGEAPRRRLQRLRRMLADVTVLPRGAESPTWHRSRLNARYHPALALAQIVLAAESFEHRMGDLTVTGYMFDMWRVFEDFVTTALRESLHSLGGHSVCQKSLSLDERDRVVMRPDLMWFLDGQVRAVVDAKYKAERPEGFPNADLYQMLAYCTVLDLPEGHLVYAKGNEPVDLHTARGSGVVIHCHALDLSVTTPELLRQVDQLAATVAQTTAALSVGT
ncbi:McrC family protein [Mycobacterium sp. 852014-52144_SCH5372336]|uniref:McrC family protein n=1 Tax=Mycobacterium sp. 852014-52144_SCH5372336 TaxID=1834115 RepID=UPI0007FE8C36|nr:restriction endonuclease [Mycobacterium sp. 852014-52144_SCH5372336]OBB71563.1 restriction endonuclease [Mycobacterium sp. 852014-52144_SCH5372336]